MRPLLPFARRLLGIPPRRFRSELATDWLPLSDGVRLATTVIRPLTGGTQRVPAVLLRIRITGVRWPKYLCPPPEKKPMRIRSRITGS